MKKAFVLRIREAIAALEPGCVSEAAWPLIIAHAAYESGWGSSRAATGHNYWNLTAGSRWRGPVIPGPDLEYSSGGEVKRIMQRFRAYESPTEATRDYLEFLEMRRYQPAREALVAGDAEGFARLLGPDRAAESPPIGGYYTLPTERYMASYLAVLDQVRGLLAAV